jgi:hypothetical protein
MTIQNESIRVNYTGDDVTVAYNMTNILVYDTAHVFVFLDDVLTPTGWTYVGEGDPNGGVVTFDTAPAAGVAITLQREVPQNQLADYVAYDRFPAETHERQLDLAAMGRQQLQDLDTRALQFPVSYTGPSTVPAPIPLSQLTTDAGAVMQWTSIGGGSGTFVAVGPENETSGVLSASVVEALPATPDPYTLYFVTGSPVP